MTSKDQQLPDIVTLGSVHYGARTASQEAAFFLPLLSTGMNLLDCGCGPGSITVGLARVVSPGRVVAVDIEPRRRDEVLEKAAKAGVDNLDFQLADAYDIPFPDGSFDAVFASAILEHLSDSDKALSEMYRVLKSGGVIGVRSPDYAGNVIAPRDPLVELAIELHMKQRDIRGGNSRMGRFLKGALHRAGFTDIRATAFVECYGSEDELLEIGETFAKANSGRTEYIELGWVGDQSKLNEIAEAVRAWSKNPEAYWATLWGEAVGWKK